MDRFSLTRFSLGEGERDIPIQQAFTERLGSLAGPAVPVEAGGQFAAAFRGQARGTLALPAFLEASAGLGSTCEARADILYSAGFSCAVLQHITGSQDRLVAAAMNGQLAGSSWGGKNIPAALKWEDRVAARAAGVKDIQTGPFLSEALTAVSNAITQISETASFAVTLPPGAELRIDSGTFRVTLDGENILHLQSGAWVTVSRDLLYLDIESASGEGLQGTLIYTERYL